MELAIAHPVIAAVARAEENAFRSAPLVLVQFGGVNGECVGRAIDNAHRTDEGRERYLVESLAVWDEVQRRVHVCAAVRAHGEFRKCEWVTILELLQEVELNGCVAGEYGSTGGEWGGDVDPLHGGLRKGGG